MSLVIYHNPRCSKSRKTLEIIQQAGVTPSIVEYLAETPSAARIVHLAGLLELPVRDLLRRNEAEFKEANGQPDLTDDAALAVYLHSDHRGIQKQSRMLVQVGIQATLRQSGRRPAMNVGSPVTWTPTSSSAPFR